MYISRLKNSEIDKERWNRAIAESTSPRINAMSWYLDIVSPGWEALVTKDMKYIMPLPKMKKLGFKYSLQPNFCQQLGIFSSYNADEQIVSLFLKKMPLIYDLQLNSKNTCVDSKTRINSVLSLSPSAEALFHGFSNNTKRNIKKSEKNNLQIVSTLSFKTFIKFFAKESMHYPKRMLPDLIKLNAESEKRDLIEIWGAYKGCDLLAAVLFIKGCHRIHYLAPVSSNKGKEYLAMYLLIRDFIYQHAESPFILDFDGSMCENVARMYRGFGAVREYYFRISRGSVLLHMVQKFRVFRNLLQLNSSLFRSVDFK